MLRVMLYDFLKLTVVYKQLFRKDCTHFHIYLIFIFLCSNKIAKEIHMLHSSIFRYQI
jgi:hypothetical protein